MLRKLLIFSLLTFFTPSFNPGAFAQASTLATEEDEFDTYETAEPEKVNDPYEKMNRKIYTFNDALDRSVLEPVAKFYRKSTPEGARDAVHNFINNLSLPISALNSFAQGRVDNGLATLSNFLINTTVGLGGFFNVAGQKGIFYRPEDFGQTLGHFGTGPGPYLMLPFFGPSTTRDLGGFVTDRVVSPLGFNAFDVGGNREFIPLGTFVGLIVISGIDTRESLIDVIDDIRRDSFDPYATIRSAYLQKRINDIKN